MSFLFIISGLLAGGFDNEGMKNIAFILATFVAGVPIAIKAYQSIRMRAFSIELLVTIAVIGAIFIQEYIEAAVVTFLFLFGDFLEVRTLAKTRSSLKELVDMAPQEAIVIRNGSQITVSVEEVEIGERVVIQSGAKIPVDGRIVSGHAFVNEAAVTGEAIPARKNKNDRVFSGTIVDNGFIEIIAEKVGEDTTFSRIIELVEEAQESKSKTEKFLNTFSHYYTPAVVALAIIVLAMTRDLHVAITFLVIACPGALVIGAPVSNVAGIGNGAKHGVLVKGGEVMENLSKVDTLVFDKTGTLTKGSPEVTDIRLFQTFEENELLRLVAQAEGISEHHLGQAMIKEAKSRHLPVTKGPEEGVVVKGHGIRAKVDGRRLVIGNRKLMKNEKVELANEISQYAEEREIGGNTAVFVAVEDQIIAVIAIADQIREDAAIALSEMRKNGVENIIMLTGDNRYTAELVATQLGIDEFYAELLPEQKVEYVKMFKDQGHIVAMAGDGINDAPAIATADVGLAMGQSGTDISMETADVVLMADKLMQFSHAYALSKATIRNMKQNTFLAVVTVFFLLIGVLFDSIHLASGMFIHEASVLIVILNGMRLIGFNHKSKMIGTKQLTGYKKQWGSSLSKCSK